MRNYFAAVGACVAVLALAACGSSESTNTTKNAANGASATAQAGSTSAGTHPSAQKALVACLKRQGVNSPPIKPGEVPTPPSGVTLKQFHEALLRCGVPTVGAPVSPTTNSVPLFNGRYTGKHLRAALTAFAACMRSHGVSLSSPNTSGKSPAFTLPPASHANEQKLIAGEHICFPLITKQLHLKVKPPFDVGGEHPPVVPGA
jgi:hypothetical protein